MEIQLSVMYRRHHTIQYRACHALVFLSRPTVSFTCTCAQYRIQSLSLLGKKKISTEFRSRKAHNKDATQPAIALWTKDAPRLKKMPNKSSISCIFSKAEQYADIPVTSKKFTKYLCLAAATHFTQRQRMLWLEKNRFIYQKNITAFSGTGKAFAPPFDEFITPLEV